MKIFVDGYLLNKEHQGTKTYIKELYKEFAKNNPKITIYIGCFKDKLIEQEFIEYSNIKFINFKLSKRVLRMLIEIPKIISKHKFNYAHFQYVIPFVKNKNCKYIVTIHDILFNDFPEYFSFFYRLKRNFLFKYSAKKSDFLLTVSEYSKNRIQKTYNLKNKQIYITPNGVNKAFFEEFDEQSSINYIYEKYKLKNYLLYVSRVEPRKNQQALLKVFQELKDDTLNLVFIGCKTIRNKVLEDVYESLSEKLKKRIYFFENIPEKDLLEFYKSAKVFVYPTLAEGFGIPPLEAGALKIPVICSNKTALQEFIFFKPYLIDVEKQEVFKNKIEEILLSKDKKKLNDIKSTIKENYSWKKSSKVLLQVLNNKENVEC